MRNGTFWATTISAGWLSSVVMLGVDRRFAWLDEASAWIRMPNSSPRASATESPAGEVPRRAGEPSTVRMLASVGPVGENEVAAKPPGGVAVPKPSWTPSCWEMSPEISTIAASISTCGRRWSSCAISCARSDWTSARARTTTALMSGAGCTLMSSVAKEVDRGWDGDRGLARDRDRDGDADAFDPRLWDLGLRLPQRFGDRAGGGGLRPDHPAQDLGQRGGVGELQAVDPRDGHERGALTAGLVEVLGEPPAPPRPGRGCRARAGRCCADRPRPAAPCRPPRRRTPPRCPRRARPRRRSARRSFRAGRRCPGPAGARSPRSERRSRLRR